MDCRFAITVEDLSCDAAIMWIPNAQIESQTILPVDRNLDVSSFKLRKPRVIGRRLADQVQERKLVGRRLMLVGRCGENKVLARCYRPELEIAPLVGDCTRKAQLLH